MSTLVYVGANVGSSLWSMFDKFDDVYVFEPDPEMFSQLKKRYKQFEWVTLVNAACANETGKAKFYITPNRVSSSMSTVSTTTHPIDHPQMDMREIEVDTINLAEYLSDQGVDYIDFYLSDAQGSDLNILKTMQPYIDEKKIDQMYIETHGDGLYLYTDLNNQFSEFKKILGDNYEFVHASLGRLSGKIVKESDIPEGEYEWDTLWKVKA
jgi:FkbM family methyltransferase|tara:strand:- start:4925 stop:5554 length:630 start_codon:yes stop_codon:yes gene_type:complete